MYNMGRKQANSPKYLSFSGIIVNITNEIENGCALRFQLQDEKSNITNFIVNNNTYFVDNKKAALGMPMTAFYDSSAATILIYPPQFTAVAANLSPEKNVKIDFFNRNLVSSDNLLSLNISPTTQIILQNNQTFMGDIRNRELMVVYTNSTRSIPAQTTPMQIIVIC